MNAGDAPIVELSQQGAGLSAQLIAILLIAAAAVVSIFLIKKLQQRLANAIAEDKQDELRLVSRLVRLLVAVIATITVFDVLGINITGLIAGLGLTGFALSFALKDAISNLLSGILLLFYRPFERGDSIEVGNYKGLVKDIDLRYTTLCDTKRTILLPNSTLFTQAIILHDHSQEPSS